MIRRMKFRIVLILILLSAFFASLAISAVAQAGEPTPLPPMIERVAPENMATPVDRLAAPPMPENPTQADYGAQVYYQICMVCHGDRGQGLTDEWRGALDVQDQDCWQSHCHASNHPPDGFVFPKYVPPVVGPLMTQRFGSALERHDYISTKMPWQAPGTRSEEEYWQLTAHLLRINGVDPGPQPLSATNAANILIHPAENLTQAVSLPTQTPAPVASQRSPFWLITGLAVGAILLLAGGIFFGLRFSKPEAD
jgi:cytochrome c5